jgi:guanylate kinase
MQATCGTIFVISGPSGVGKGTLCKWLLANHDGLHLSISATSRPKRPDEQHGVDYLFVTPEAFQQMIADGAFLEYAQYNQNWYGTPKHSVEAMIAQGKHVLLEIDTQGALMVKELFPQAYMIFIEPPSLAELERRLRTRGTNTEEDIQQRLEIARQELTLRDHFDAIVVNEALSESQQRLVQLLTEKTSEPMPR